LSYKDNALFSDRQIL